jgi:hypothetical protein
MHPIKFQFIWLRGFREDQNVKSSHLLTFHILIFSSETHQPNGLKLGQCAKLFWTASPRPVEIAAVQSIPVVIDRCVHIKPLILVPSSTII